LLGSIPDLADPAPRLQPIDGNVPNLYDQEMGDRCYFADRCPKAMEDCLTKPPELEVEGRHATKCYLAETEYNEGRSLPDGYFTTGEQ
jgi:peptide/nickel transport system ATP-binding protein